MKNLFKIISLLLVGLVSISLIGCSNDTGPATDSYTVEYVDYDGTVLKSITCIVGEACVIEAPANPNNKENTYFTRWSLFDSEIDEIDRDTTIEAIYTLDNRLLSVGSITVVFYSFFIISGIIVALSLGMRECKRIGLKQDDLIDGFLWIVPVAILGARLWYVAFEPTGFIYGSFFPSLLRVLGFTSGTLDFSSFGLSGLAIHGAFFTALVCVYFFTKKRKMNVYKILDIVAVGFIIAQAFGRWGNFFNQEAHGGIVGGMTDGVANLTLEQQFNFLKNTIGLPNFIVNNMYIVRGWHSLSVEPLTGFYQPTFFYESFINVIGFGVMLILRRTKKLHFGELMSVYLIWYGGLRIFIEAMRTDPLVFEIFGITMKSAIVTSVLMILGGIALSVFIRLRGKGGTYASVPGYFGYKKEEVIEEAEEVTVEE
ncbi:MAG: prolipoprotein diacylglyceryl transferase [Tenericutes bacterium]|nr:prolipoprotein diacylglyceryl transferase [Mycoplasmatota bacterium]